MTAPPPEYGRCPQSWLLTKAIVLLSWHLVCHRVSPPSERSRGHACSAPRVPPRAALAGPQPPLSQTVKQMNNLALDDAASGPLRNASVSSDTPIGFLLQLLFLLAQRTSAAQSPGSAQPPGNSQNIRRDLEEKSGSTGHGDLHR